MISGSYPNVITASALEESPDLSTILGESLYFYVHVNAFL